MKFFKKIFGSLLIGLLLSLPVMEANAVDIFYDKIQHKNVEDQVLAHGGGGGDVVGPASAVDENIAVYDGITGKLLKDGGATIASLTNIVTSVFTRTGAIVATAGDYLATLITNTPAGDIAAVDVQTAINELDTEKMAIATYDPTTVSGDVFDLVNHVGEYIDLDTTSDPAYQEKRMYWDDSAKTFAAYDDITGTSYQYGQENVLRAKNDTGAQIDNGDLVYLSGHDGTDKLVKLADSTTAVTALGTIAMATHDVSIGAVGKYTRLGAVNDVSTTGCTTANILYLGTAGAWTETIAVSPNYLVTIGKCAKGGEAVNGIIEVQINAESNTQDVIKIFNGSVLEDTSTTVASNGTIVTLSYEKNGGGNLSLFFDAGFTNFVAAPATVALTAGSDTAPTLNYVYIPKSTNTLTANQSGFPTNEQVVPVATVFVQSASSVVTDGVFKMHAWTDHLSNTVDQGHLSHVNNWIRAQPASWSSGVVPTTTITVNGGAIDNVDFSNTSGTVLQLHEHAFPALDMAGSDPIFIINDSTTAYDRLTDLSGLDTTSLGVTLRNNNTYYSVVVIGVISEDAGDSQIYGLAPSCSYANATDVVTDPLGCSNYAIPSDFTGTGFLIARLNLRYQTAASGTITEISTEDCNQGECPVVAGGGGSVGGGPETSDNLWRVFNVSDSTKEMAFDASNITTSTTRTFDWPDNNGTVITSGNLSDITSLASATTATTQSSNDNSTKLATTAYSDAGKAEFDTFLELTDTIGSYTVNRVLFEGASDVLDNAALTFTPGTATLATTNITGALTGNVTGNVSGTSATVTGAAQSAITSAVNLPWTGLTTGTDGEIPTFDASGNPAFVGVGTATHVLTSNGIGLAPTFQDAGGGGASWGDTITRDAAVDGLTLDMDGNSDATNVLEVIADGASLTQVGVKIVKNTGTGTGLSISGTNADVNQSRLAQLISQTSTQAATATRGLEIQTSGGATTTASEGGYSAKFDNPAITSGGVYINQIGSTLGRNAIVVDAPSGTSTVGLKMDVGNTTVDTISIEANGISSGSIARFYSNSSSATARSLIEIINDHTSATATTMLDIKQDATSTGDLIKASNGASEVFVIEDDGAFTPVTADPCAISGAGAMFYNATSNYMCFCNGSGDDIKMNDNSTACF